MPKLHARCSHSWAALAFALVATGCGSSSEAPEGSEPGAEDGGTPNTASDGGRSNTASDGGGSNTASDGGGSNTASDGGDSSTANDGAATICTPAALRCASTGTPARERCDEAGRRWLRDDCPDGQVCSGAGACQATVCEAGATRCNGTVRELCAVNGGSWMTAPCPSGQVCSPGPGGGTCVEHPCDPGPPTCSADGRSVVTCSGDGAATQPTVTPCRAGEGCFSGICAGTSFVNGDVVVLRASDTPARLPAGTYGLAIVDTAATSEAQVSFPVVVNGDVVNAVPPPPAPSPAPRRSWVCRHPEMSRLSAQLRRMPIAASPPPPPVAYAVGDTRTFYYPDYSSGSLSVVPRTATLRLASSAVNYWEDTTEGGVGAIVAEKDLVALASRVDDGVIPRDTAIFGPFTDVDANGKIDAFFTDHMTSADPDAAAFVFGATITPPDTYGMTVDHGEVIYISSLGMSAGELASVMAHELQHLIYFGQEWGPHLPDDFWNAPDVSGDVYAVEGIAELASAWSGQDDPWFNGVALSTMKEWSAARLLAPAYQAEVMVNAALYGFGGLWFEYLFDQAGAVDVQGAGTIVDRGGAAQVLRFERSPQGLARLLPMDGRSFPDAYTHFGAALLAQVDPDVLSARAKADRRFHFVPSRRDPVWGGALGGAPDSATNGRVKAAPWSSHPTTMRAGGLGIYSTRVTGSAQLSISRASTRVVVLRH